MDNFILSYNGNKYLESKKYCIDEGDEYDNVYEPFCGIFGFSRWYSINHKNTIFHLNDINEDLINFYRRLQNDFEGTIDYYKNIIESYPNDKACTDDTDRDPIVSFMCAGLNFRMMRLDKGLTKIRNFLLKKEEYKELFNRCYFYCEDAFDFLKGIEPNSLVYFDPPYFQSNNREYQNHMGKNKDGITDETMIYVLIYKWFKHRKSDCILVMNKIDFLHYKFRKYCRAEYEGRYQNYGKSKKVHRVYTLFRQSELAAQNLHYQFQHLIHSEPLFLYLLNISKIYRRQMSK